MRSLVLLQIVALALSLPIIRAQESSGQTPRYEVIMYEGFPPESFPEEARKELKPEQPLLSIRVEAGVKFHAEGRGMMFEGRLSGVKDGGAELEIERSRWGSSACSPITATVKLGEAVSPGGCIFSGVVYSYYFRVKSAAEGEGERLDGEGTPNNGLHPTANQRASYRELGWCRRCARGG